MLGEKNDKGKLKEIAAAEGYSIPWEIEEAKMDKIQMLVDRIENLEN